VVSSGGLVLPNVARTNNDPSGNGLPRLPVRPSVRDHARVKFTGQVPHADIPRLIAQADIGIDPAPGLSAVGRRFPSPPQVFRYPFR
jgi:hypothetical protein